MSSNYFRTLKKQRPLDNRPKYLRYGDVFMSARTNQNRQQQRYAPNFSTTTMSRNEQSNSEPDAANIDRIRTTNRMNNQYNDNIDYLSPNNNRVNSTPFNQQMYNGSNLDDDYDENDLYNNEEYPFHTQSNSRVNYKKRILPPLQQRYASRNSQYDLQYDNQYWDDYDPYPSSKTNKKQEAGLSFKFIWQKFIITFTSILSIVCIAWIAYHWNSSANDNNKVNNGPELIEPDKPSFKVLPDVPGGINIPYQDKSIYSRVDPNFNKKTNEKLRAQQEVPVDIPKASTQQVPNVNSYPIEEYSIIDEKDYYVKCPISGNAAEQLKAFKKRLSEFPDTDMLENSTCAIRTVANTSGKRGKFILIGPFCDDNTAKQIGHFCKIKGEIISVKKVNKN
ncbi:MAG: hypothetical protein IJU54_02015 [Alphaproteobacteria bacterium]|nr:hypothetical protein [Alphaproteobacteria bacterium]